MSIPYCSTDTPTLVKKDSRERRKSRIGILPHKTDCGSLFDFPSGSLDLNRYKQLQKEEGLKSLLITLFSKYEKKISRESEAMLDEFDSELQKIRNIFIPLICEIEYDSFIPMIIPSDPGILIKVKFKSDYELTFEVFIDLDYGNDYVFFLYNKEDTIFRGSFEDMNSGLDKLQSIIKEQ